jgi:TRAP transporter 4TM/12TM fusion protein
MSAQTEAEGIPGGVEKAQALVEREEGATNRLRGWLGASVAAVAVAMSVFHLYAAYGIVPAYVLRPVHLAFALVLVFLLYPAVPRLRDRIMPWDWLFAAAALAAIGYIVWGGDELAERATFPEQWDVIVAVGLVVLLLEATRRTSGWIMLAVLLLFLAYALFGSELPAPWTHRGYDLPRLAGHLVLTLEGIFGAALDVSSTLIILFTIFGAVLQHTGAGRFFLDFAFAVMGRRPGGAGRTVVLASFLLGSASGSGVANTVTVGSVAYPVLARSGYGREAAGGLLAASGLGALIAPPVLGAAAFLIAEFLKVSYLDVVRMAIIPACLYYGSLFLMVQLDARRLGMRAGEAAAPGRATALLRTYGFHFLSLISIVAFMLAGFSPTTAVFWAIAVAVAVSFLRRDAALWPTRFAAALADGAKSMLAVAVTCAGAGIIVGVVTLTGLGLKFSSIVIQYAGGSLLLTALYTGLIVWVVGLAVPVTASYIICAVVAAPALIHMGVPDFAAHMFIFYYAVLSEVSPPTALSPFAAAAITGADPYRTTLQAWKYTLPAFLLPFAFTLDPAGAGLLLKAGWMDSVVACVTAAIGILALAGGVQGWLLRATRGPERAMLILAGLLLMYVHPWSDAAGVALTVLVVTMQRLRRT